MSALSILDGFDGELPLSQAMTLPAECFYSPEFAEAELQAVFAQTWQYVGSLQQLPEVGSYLTHRIGSESVFAMKGEDGQVRVFLNVCRHRAAPILSDDCGQCSKLRCRYHGWTYDLQGQLRGVPEFDGVESFRREENGLIELQASLWGEFLFARLERGNDDLADHLGPLIEDMAPKLAGFRFHKRIVYRVDSNWKLYVDNYLDGGYHVNAVHPALAGSLDYKKYCTDLYETCSVQRSPLVANVENPEANRTRKGDSASYWWAYPNFMLNHYEGVMDLNFVIPRSAESCDVVFDFFFADDGGPGSAAFREESLRVASGVQAEDAAICAAVQANIRSRGYSQGRFSVKRENGGYHFHRLLARHLKTGLPMSPAKGSA